MVPEEGRGCLWIKKAGVIPQELCFARQIEKCADLQNERNTERIDWEKIIERLLTIHQLYLDPLWEYH